MEKSFHTPQEVTEANIQGGVSKVSLPLWKMIMLGIMAGAFIAIGGATSSTAAHAIENVGVARLVAGAIFPVGLMIIVLVGGELFTGNCLIFMGVLDKKVSVGKFLLDLLIVWFSNLIGALLVDVCILYSGNLDYSAGLLGAYTIKVALGKASIAPIRAITSGILCNVLVCIAILMAGAAKDVAGKIWAIFFPIMAFVVGGFEHCVANMFYIPMGMMAATNSTYVAKAQEVYGLSVEQLSQLSVAGAINNLLLVTIGNMIGGMLCVGLPCYLNYKKTE